MIGWHASFQEQSLVLRRYPLPRSGRTGVILATDLVEVCVGWAPPAVRTRSGEFLFVPAPQAPELAAFATKHRLPFVRRADVWAALLEPFLDTQHSPEFEQGTLRFLSEQGLTEEEVAGLRNRVGARMLSLTAVTWEWVYYGLFDVLEAMRPRLFPAGRRFATFYDEAMAIAGLGKCQPSDAADFSTFYHRGS